MEQLSLFRPFSVGGPISDFKDLWNSDFVFYDPYYDGSFVFCNDLRKVVTDFGRRVILVIRSEFYYFDEYLFCTDRYLCYAVSEMDLS